MCKTAGAWRQKEYKTARRRNHPFLGKIFLAVAKGQSVPSLIFNQVPILQFCRFWYCCFSLSLSLSSSLFSSSLLYSLSLWIAGFGEATLPTFQSDKLLPGALTFQEIVLQSVTVSPRHLSMPHRYSSLTMGLAQTTCQGLNLVPPKSMCWAFHAQSDHMWQ